MQIELEQREGLGNSTLKQVEDPDLTPPDFTRQQIINARRRLRRLIHEGIIDPKRQPHLSPTLLLKPVI